MQEAPFDSRVIDEENNIITPHAISHRRKIGAFYTPLNVTTILCKWGLRTKSDTVLEPCFGGCTFLEALLSRLKELGENAPSSQLFGCDIDPLAFRYLETLGTLSTLQDHFAQRDFLSLNPKDIREQKVDLIIGNPPYIRHSKFDSDQRRNVDLWIKAYGIKLNGRASLWAYFVLHALNFLKIGGRIAWVLPGSFLTAAYSEQVRALIVKQFTEVTAITLSERLFLNEGTEETTVILLAEGFKQLSSNEDFSVNCFDTVTELATYINNWHSTPHSNGAHRHENNGVIPVSALKSIELFQKHEKTKYLGDVATTQIGLVTGDINYFIKSQTAWKELGIDSANLEYILPKSKSLQGILLNHDDVRMHRYTDVPCMTLNCPTIPDSKPIKNYLNKYSEAEIKANATFRKRPVWHYFLDKKIPDAFLIFMTQLGPRLILNDASANCTNSLYRTYFHEGIDKQSQMVIAISMHTTFTQLSAELIGQGRGSGALKLEPSHARRLHLHIPTNKSSDEINVAFSTLDNLLRTSKYELAREFSDSFIFHDEPALLNSLPALRAGLKIGRARRMRNSKSEN